MHHRRPTPSDRPSRERRRSRRTPLLTAAAAGAVLLSACAPPFSELQSARLAGPDRVEITPGGSVVSFSFDDESNRVQNHFGFQVAMGVSDRMDLRGRYERVLIETEDGEFDGDVDILALGLKLGLVQDVLALYVPVGFAVGEDIKTSETVQIHPTALLTLPLHESVEINTSAKALIPVTDRDMDDHIAFNVGLGLGPDLSRWAIRPEFGILMNPGEDGRFRHFSLGFTYYFSR